VVKFQEMIPIPDQGIDGCGLERRMVLRRKWKKILRAAVEGTQLFNGS